MRFVWPVLLSCSLLYADDFASAMAQLRHTEKSVTLSDFKKIHKSRLSSAMDDKRRYRRSKTLPHGNRFAHQNGLRQEALSSLYDTVQDRGNHELEIYEDAYERDEHGFDHDDFDPYEYEIEHEEDEYEPPEPPEPEEVEESENEETEYESSAYRQRSLIWKRR